MRRFTRLTKRLPDLALRSVPNADGRRRPVQTYRRLRRQLIADQGGGDSISAAGLVAVETLAQAAALQREEFARYVADLSHDPARFIGLSNLLLGAVRTLGLKRVPRDVTTLRDIILEAAERTEKAQDERSTATPADDTEGAP
jgi:hypothetical protein